ncbi:alpha/beta fold hydrolase [Aquimarina spinulae]|uniref:alpha/beta fold hydrolase n=1 Tax=Aquimarina spinulae TaxID=1192023 RepID=UPI00131F1F1E|nr:alpha/beta fold hydrolase [Aquimarina spinulae]
MKTTKITFCLVSVLIITSSICVITSRSSSKFPKFNSNQILKEGDVLIEKGIHKNREHKKYPKKIKTDYISLAVKENRNNPASRVITIPVKRLHSLSDTPKAPIFLLDGGPGNSNLSNNLVKNMLWLLDNHDIVMVGYRGVDGSVTLDSKAFEEALMVDTNAFTESHFEKLGMVWKNELIRFKNEGIDIDGYNVIEVIDDIELVRNILGYNKINLFGFSYGTRLAYLSGLRYPESIHRSIIGGISPPGHFVWNPEITDAILKKYGDLWKENSLNLKRSPDIIKTIQSVFLTLPEKWKKIDLDPGKIRVMMFNIMYKTSGVGKIFDAFVAAENGDYSGLALLVMMYDLLPEMENIVWGDLFAKALSSDYLSGTDYINGMNSKNNLLGAPMSKLFSLVSFSDWKIHMIPEKYRKLDTSYINTLMIAGNFDIATPLENTQKMIKYLPNGKLAIFSDYAHHDYSSLLTNTNSITMLKEFYLTGEVLSEDIIHTPAKIGEPKKSPQKMGKKFYRLKRLGLLKTIVKLFM